MAAEKGFSAFGSRLAEPEEAWRDRLTDAEALRGSGRFATAVTMGVYALEILLKAGTCRILGLTEMPRAFEIHDLEGLRVLSGLLTPLGEQEALETRRNWHAVRSMAARVNELRYGPNQRIREEEAASFFSKLNEEPHGVIPWILSRA